jgi:hypothetical protein
MLAAYPTSHSAGEASSTPIAVSASSPRVHKYARGLYKPIATDVRPNVSASNRA